MSEPNIATESNQPILLTKDGFAKLHAELELLTTVKRPDIANRIRESQQHGEFSEDNSELDEVKFEQAMVETRIAELKDIFSNAIVLEDDMIPIDQVGIASLVSVSDLDEDDSFDLRVVSMVEADPRKNHISTESPMGTALLGAVLGQQIKFMTPDGEKHYRVDSISR